MTKKTGIEYQKKLVADFQEQMKGVAAYQQANLYTVLFDLVLESGLDEVKTMLADVENDMLPVENEPFAHRIIAEME